MAGSRLVGGRWVGGLVGRWLVDLIKPESKAHERIDLLITVRVNI